MSASAARPLLARLARPPAHVELGLFPSPLERRDGLAARLGLEAVLVKRDDLNAVPLGGNKVRALEWLLPTAGAAVVSMGGYGSTHAAALATYASRTGRVAVLALFPQPWTAAVAQNLARTARAAEVELAPSRAALPLALWRAWRRASRLAAPRGTPTWIAPGAATPLGVLGSVNAALELVAQLDAAGEPPPDVIVAPLGSGGTVAGLRLGLALAGRPIPICAVRVADRFVANGLTVGWLVRGAMRLLRRHGGPEPATLPRLVVVGDHLGPGYGHPTARGMAAAALAAAEGLTLDPTYGAKAFGALLSLGARFRRPCFWHTFDARGPRPGSAPEPPIVRRARAYAEAGWRSPKST